MTERRRISELLRAGPAVFPAAIFFVIASALAFARIASERVYSDEQIFLGGAGLMARGGGLIYRDFFYTHMPTQALLMAALFKFTAHWTLVARSFDGLCGAMLATVLFEAARRAFVETTLIWRIALASAVGAIFIFNPVTADAVGKAWNHDFAALACVVGFLLLASGLGKAQPRWWMVASGACAAISMTTRLTFAPPLIAFPLLIFLAPGYELRSRARLLGWWALGGIIAAAPAIWVCLQAPYAAYFDNVRYPELTKRFYGELYGDSRATFPNKLDYVRQVIAGQTKADRGTTGAISLQIFLALGVIALLAATRPLRVRVSLIHCRFVCLIVLILVTVATMFVPSPIYHQYLYAPLPFIALLITWGAASLGLAKNWWTRVPFIGLAITCIFFGRQDYHGVSMLMSPSSWAPNQSHEDGKRLARLAGRGKALTFMPGFALEAGMSIYPELSIGRYATRSADFLRADQREQLHVADMAAMKGWFENDPPAAVLFGKPMSPLEKQIADLAVDHGYLERSFGDAMTLYLPPKRH